MTRGKFSEYTENKRGYLTNQIEEMAEEGSISGNRLCN